jgi:hypothetical protein
MISKNYDIYKHIFIIKMNNINNLGLKLEY